MYGRRADRLLCLLHAERAGGLGEILTEVEAYQAGRFDALRLLGDRRYYEVAYRHSVAWARQVQQAMSPD